MKKNIIDTIYPYLMPHFDGKIHKIELIESKYSFSVSKRFCGKICDGRPESEYAVLYQNLNAKQQKKLAQNIALFFYLMHQIDYSKIDISMPNEAVDHWDVTIKEDFNFDEVRKTLLNYQIDLNDYKVQNPNLAKALCHNDLSGSNILLDNQKEDVLVGIIDFGNVMVMPKYQEFFPLYKIDRKLAVDVLDVYNQLTASKIELKQIDFMVLNYIGYGLSKAKDNISPYFLKLLKPFL